MAAIETSGLNINRSNWRDYANCAVISEPELFPPGNGESLDEAKIVCRGCVAARECLGFAVRVNRRVGIRRVMSDEEIDGLFEERRLAEEAVSETVD